MNDKQASYEAYEQALSFNPNNLMCLNNYAYFLSLDGQRLDYAAAMSRRTINAEPTNATFLDTYAWILSCKSNTRRHTSISRRHWNTSTKRRKTPASTTTRETSRSA